MEPKQDPRPANSALAFFLFGRPALNLARQEPTPERRVIHVVIDGYNPMSTPLLGEGMSTYRQLKQQIAALEKKATLAMKEEARKVIESIKQQIAEFGLSAADLGLEIARRAGAKTAKGKKLVLTPKYREPATGKTWNGHGKRPGWIVAAQKKGKLEELSIVKPALAKASPQARTGVMPAVKKSQKKTAPVAKPAAKKAPKKPAAPAPKNRTAALKSAAKKPVAKKAAPSPKKPQPAAMPAAPVTAEPAVVTA